MFGAGIIGFLKGIKIMSETFNPEMQYRCTIIRGKAQNEIEDLLPVYAKIITDICPCQKDNFINYFDQKIAKYLFSPTKKTIANHRTEISGKLFGMWREDEKQNIFASKRTENLLVNKDFPQFFKDIVYRFQFPNGMDKIHTTIDRKQNSIKLRPVAFILKALLIIEDKGFSITKHEVGYYILNCLQVLQGRIDPEVVVDKIIENRKKDIFKKVEYPGKASSYNMQHISELLNLIELANLIRQERTKNDVLIKLNRKELSIINYFAKSALESPKFDVYSFRSEDDENTKIKEKFYYEWNKYFSSSDDNVILFETPLKNILGNVIGDVLSDPNVIGAEGENLVFEKEKQRVREFNERLVNKVINFANQRGLGFDIQSIKAESGPTAEHAIYLEVKTTKRITRPRRDSMDSFDLTRNEWIAAEQHRDNYFVYRVYITNEGIFVLIMNNPVSLKEQGIIFAEPTKYHVEFKEEAGLFEKW